MSIIGMTDSFYYNYTMDGTFSREYSNVFSAPQTNYFGPANFRSLYAPAALTAA